MSDKKLPPGNTKPVDEISGVETTGHSWDGIEELNHPLPRWWLWTFYATIVWGVIYTIAYPAWPLVSSATAGVLGWSTRGEVAADEAAFAERNAPLANALAEADLQLIAASPQDELHRYAVASGAAVFRNNCSQCHGSGAAGGVGYPNLLDSAWLWGGEVEEIAYTVRHGIRNEIDFDSRWSEMPAYGDVFTDEEVDAVVEHVRAISGQDFNAELAETGAVLFDEQCSACHGVEGMGNHDLGAPNLTDAVWLYGGDREALEYTVINARFGVMPPWGPPRLTDAEVAAVAVYVHQLGGGETPAVDATDE